MPIWAWVIIGVLGFIYVAGETSRDIKERKAKERDQQVNEEILKEIKDRT